LNYKLFNRFLLTATLRADASSRFAPETRWGLFPSAAFAWNIADEKFLENSDNVNELRFRLSYGSTGQQNINNDYAYQATYYASTSNFMYREGNEFYTTYRPSAFDRSIKWEVTKTANIGVDYGFFKNRLYGAIDLYKRYTSNLLMNSVKVAAGSNFAESIDQNIGEMSSKGMEFAIGGVPVRTKNFSWNLNFNFAWNASKIEKLTVYDGPPEKTWVKTGYTSSNRYAQYHKVGNTPYTYYLARQAYDDNGKPIEKFYNPNYNTDIPGSQEYVADDAADANKWDTKKSSLVPYYGGISTSVKYKQWDLGSNMHYAFGQYVYWETMSSGSNNSFFDASNQYPTNTFRGWAPEWAKQHYFSDYWLFKGNYFKIDNIVLGYTFNRILKNKSSLRLGAGIQNVATITNYPGIDPEVYSGIDGSSTPKKRMYMLSLNLKF
jgi:iron complex outermembrane receptor protein